MPKEDRFLRNAWGLAFAIIVMILLASPASAARIGDLQESNIMNQVRRFFSFRDPAVIIALVGSLLLGLNAGLLGSFIVVRKTALVGDMLAHAVLPGIALGFLWNQTKNPLAIFIGAVVIGLLATFVMQAIIRTTRLKQDAAIGIVLSSFYAVGVCLINYIGRLPTASKSGVESYLFGKAAALSSQDIWLMLGTTALTLICLGLFYKSFLAASFDRQFASSLGLPILWLDRLLMLLTSFAIIVAMQAVGVVLVSAMLIIPAATAYLLTDRMASMMWVSAGVGVLSACLGAFFSFLGSSLPTGPFMVLSAAFFFCLAFLFGKRHGWVSRLCRQGSRRERVERENTLKSIYRLLEAGQFQEEAVSMEELGSLRNESAQELEVKLKSLAAHNLATTEDGQTRFTPDGYLRACQVVRNHRLWELYLTQVAKYQSDHVHDDAEEIEHILGEETVLRLEKALSFPNKDPHGKPIPSLRDLGRGAPGSQPESGYAAV